MKALLATILIGLPFPATADVVSLSPERVEAAKEAGARLHAHDAQLGVEPQLDRSVHGEIGFGVGSGGYNSVYGTAMIPVGANTVVAVSIASEGDRRSFRRR